MYTQVFVTEETSDDSEENIFVLSCQPNRIGGKALRYPEGFYFLHFIYLQQN
jgi:hypothetical protein